MRHSGWQAKKIMMLLCLTGLLSGCLEAEYQFQTVVNEDGSVFRETLIEGRGFQFFLPPEGKGWQVQINQAENKGTFFLGPYYSVQAHGQFKPNEALPPDYRFNLKKQMEGWGAEQMQAVEALGIRPPYEQFLYSRNNIRIRLKKGWLTHTYIYEETFENKGLIELLLIALIEELKAERKQSGQEWSEAEVGQLARQKLEEDILSRVRFESEVEMPGQLLDTNAHEKKGNHLRWVFSMQDFQNNYGRYELKAVSRTLRSRGMALMFILTAFGVLAGTWVFLKVRRRGTKRQSNQEDLAE